MVYRYAYFKNKGIINVGRISQTESQRTVMNIFIDTSSLFKKYHTEDGTQKLFKILKNVSEITVSPITYLEITNTAYRLYHHKMIGESALNDFCKEVNHDFKYFKTIPWDKDLQNNFFHWVRNYQIKSLDTIQLASAQIAKCKQFITSDKNQYKIAMNEFEKVLFI